MIGTLIVAFLITIISFAFGVLVTLFFSKNDTFERVQERIESVRVKEQIGIVERPSAEDVRRRGTIEEETEEEMSRQLKKMGLKPKR